MITKNCPNNSRKEIDKIPEEERREIHNFLIEIHNFIVLLLNCYWNDSMDSRNWRYLEFDPNSNRLFKKNDATPHTNYLTKFSREHAEFISMILESRYNIKMEKDTFRTTVIISEKPNPWSLPPYQIELF